MANQNFNQPNQNQNRSKEKEIEARLENYTGPEGITTKQLEIGLWYVEHKRQLRLALIGFLILIGAVSWVYTVYGFAYYLARGMSQDEILAKQLVEASSIGHDYVLQVSAKELAVGPVEIIKSASEKYDLYVQLKNDNQRWWAEFDYYFTASGRRTKKASGYILPMEVRYLMSLAQDFTGQPADAKLIMENIKWRRIDQHQIPAWSSYYKSHLDISSSDIKFTPADLSLLSEKLNLNQLSFNAVNNTAYNYWEVGFTILLYGGGNLLNINHYGLSDFMSGQKRQVELSWPGVIGRVDKVEIIPEINIMKDNIYIKYEGGTGQAK